MQVAIIGAGPRGLAVAERLINLADDDTQIDVQIYDPYAIGGRVWDPTISQNKQFLMNTVIDQITLFNDESIVNGGTPYPGPTMIQWLKQAATAFLASHSELSEQYAIEASRLTHPDDFASRGMMGVYAAWFFEWLTRRVRPNQTLNFTKQSVINVVKIGAMFQLKLADGAQILADHVVMALGHSDDHLTEEETAFKTFAAQHHLKYVAPTHPAEADLSDFNENDTVIMRGLGLSFFDYVAALSIGKGGQFTRDGTGELVYEPSGREPHVVAGSRGGFPLHARGVNKKLSGELYQPVFFTLSALNVLRVEEGGHMTYESFENLIVKELTYKYWLNRLDSKDNQLTPNQTENFKKALLTGNQLNETAKHFGLTDIPAFDIELIRNPARDLSETVAYAAWFLQYLSADIEDAKLGNKNAPYAGTFDIMRDIRDLVRDVIAQDYFSADDYEKFMRWFKPLDISISVGPPLERVEQLKALIKAGIFEVTAANIKVSTGDGKFEARDVRGQKFQGNALIEARLGPTDMSISSNPLITNLRHSGMFVQPLRTRGDGSTYKLGAINVDPTTFEVIDKSGAIISHLYVYGMPLEGLKWFGTVIPRPRVNTVILREGAWIAKYILAHQ
ncbi:FAD/NAD(P)-binding protein [uncultured Leuconostoc sp.]|uniref:FAD/NAD(P)-binding protein n=1 Tax=uncultured Leuconostoc sp. TaxID=173262 RepID=UPI0025FC84DE|nr:FAD/NAD(P)-binding protein [uncultured Leuconostoc sp.]